MNKLFKSLTKLTKLFSSFLYNKTADSRLAWAWAGFDIWHGLGQALTFGMGSGRL